MARFLAVMLVCFCPVVVFTQSAQSRTVSLVQGHPLAELLRPGDEEVRVVLQQDPPDELVPTSLIDFMARFADVIVVGDVVNMESHLTSGGDWIQSIVTCSTLEVLKAPTRSPAAPGAELAFTWDGGETYINGTKVVAAISWMHRPELGKRYLMFFRINPQTKQIGTGPSSVFEMLDTGFRSLKAHQPLNDIEKKPPIDVLALIRSASH